MLATQMARNASEVIGRGTGSLVNSGDKTWVLVSQFESSVAGPAGSAEQLRLCPKRMWSMSYSSLKYVVRMHWGLLALGGCRRHQPHGRIYSIQRLFSQEHLFNCRRAVRKPSCLASVFQRFVEGPGRAFCRKRTEDRTTHSSEVPGPEQWQALHCVSPTEAQNVFVPPPC